MLDVRLLKVNPITQAGVTPTCQMRWEVSMLYIYIPCCVTQVAAV